MSEPDSTRWSRLRTFLAGASSAAVVLLAFLIPSLQDQWDRREARQAVDRYAEVGSRLLTGGHYASAEQAYTRAVELAGYQRLDLYERQLMARVMRVYEDSAWRGKVADEVTEADFLYLLEFDAATNRVHERADVLTAYGAYLASQQREEEAQAKLLEAVRIAPQNADAHVQLGNVHDDLARPVDAEREYRLALALDPKSAAAHYNLGLLLLDLNRPDDAGGEFRAALALRPRDTEIRRALTEAEKALNRADRESPGLRSVVRHPAKTGADTSRWGFESHVVMPCKSFCAR
ncbi:MAG TPA: tetratricopeptide repeat protein [Steroidobacteraceae bacterium]|nr:tetratricopeptide repeat protein [Steroidobacteraceae bacterium]